MTNTSTRARLCPACRATVLSQYNSDPLCASLWDSAPMRRALARVDLPAVVAIFRSAAGSPRWSWET